MTLDEDKKEIKQDITNGNHVDGLENNVIPIKIPMIFLQKQKNSFLKFIWNLKGPRIAKTIMKKNKVVEFVLPNLKTYYKMTVTNTVWYWRRDTQTNGVKSPEKPLTHMAK